MLISARQRELIQHLWREGRLSRSDLCDRMHLSANSVGVLSSELVRMGVLSECQPQPSRGGRPRVPLEIDGSRRSVVGLHIGPGHVHAARLSLRGNLIGRVMSQNVESPERVATTAAGLLRNMKSDDSMGVGLSVAGFVDPESLSILLSAAVPTRQTVNLVPVRDAAEDCPLVIENDMHALAARWLLSHRVEAEEDVLLAWLEDGSIGATLIVGGKPNRGCITGGNELGHMRQNITTDLCYCGQVGCLERIFSTPQLRRCGGKTDLATAAADFQDGSSPIHTITEQLAMGLANVVNFIRPHRLVLVSQFTRCDSFCDGLIRRIRSSLLPQLADRVRVDLWDQPAMRSAETAGWLAIAHILHGGWGLETATSTNGKKVGALS